MPFPFQREAWQAYLSGEHGLVNAPTGSGKTYSLILPILLEYATAKARYADKPSKQPKGLQAIWLTPIRALTKEIQAATERAAEALGIDFTVAVRSGDTKTSVRRKQITKPPNLLITTPESLHLLLATKGYPKYFKQLKAVVADEWHELLGTKRGVQVELALSRLRAILPDQLKTWGISATIGNMDEALQVLLGSRHDELPHRIIKAQIDKKIEVVSVLPEEIERFPWSGHLGIHMIEQVVPILRKSRSTLLFTNTRSQCELWYQRLLEAAPDLIGSIAMHHGSIARETREWVEDAIHNEVIKCVVCTSSLDLGVDFRPVETIIQIGSPKGVARFMQRAGRSGHRPGEVSRIYFVPTHSLELVESVALQTAIDEKYIESRVPYIRSFDVLVQYLVTLAVSEGFKPEIIIDEVRQTYSYSSITDEEFGWCLHFVVAGSPSLEAYSEYQKVDILEDGTYKVTSRGVAMRHRMSMGTIVGNTHMTVKFLGGKRIGQIEERFVSQLSPGDVFWFAGRALKLVRIKDMIVQVKRSGSRKGKVPSWAGSRMPLSVQMADTLRQTVHRMATGEYDEPELHKLAPLTELQAERSYVPRRDELLIEYFKDREGYHLLLYPFEGRQVHEGVSMLIAWRISQMLPITFSIAMNDYGIELLSDVEIPIETALKSDLFDSYHLEEDIRASLNAVEMAKRQFRDIASIAGLVFSGYPGNRKKTRHLQASSQLFFGVFGDYEPDNLLYLQAFEEVMTFQLQQDRLRRALVRMQESRHLLSRPKKATPFAFPIMVDRLRERLTSETLQDRIKKMKLRLIA